MQLTSDISHGLRDNAGLRDSGKGKKVAKDLSSYQASTSAVAGKKHEDIGGSESKKRLEVWGPNLTAFETKNGQKEGRCLSFLIGPQLGRGLTVFWKLHATSFLSFFLFFASRPTAVGWAGI